MKSSLSAAFSVGVLCVLNACGGSANGGGGGAHAATHFVVTAPATTSATVAFNITVVALDASNQTASGYAGSVHFTSSDPQAILSGDSTLINGIKDFTETLASIGSQTITATDTADATITGSSSGVQVATNPNPNGFQPTGNMGAFRELHTATLLPDGKVLVAGGVDGSNGLATAELYDPVAGTFTTTGTMTAPHFDSTATLLAHGPAATNGKVLIAGGTDNTAELFDPATGTFAATGNMTVPRDEPTATLLEDGKVLVAGGFGKNSAELFDPATGSFTATGAMSQDRDSFTATLLNDGTVLITGGEDSNRNPIATAELYSPSTGTFTVTGSMSTAREFHTATLLNTGKVLVTGGSDLKTAELFDPSTGSFSATGSLGSEHTIHTATLLADGTVLIAGGTGTPNGSGTSSAVAEIFDPVTGNFTFTGSMRIGRYSHTATLLNNGAVLVTGGSGQGDPVVVLNSAELYK